MCPYVQWLELNFIRAWNAPTVAMLLYCTLTYYLGNKVNGRLNMALNTPSAFCVHAIRVNVNHPRDIHHGQIDPTLTFPLAGRCGAPTAVAKFSQCRLFILTIRVPQQWSEPLDTSTLSRLWQDTLHSTCRSITKPVPNPTKRKK